MQPDPDYAGSNEFLRKYAEELGLPHRVVEMTPGKPIFLMEWTGTQPGTRQVSPHSLLVTNQCEMFNILRLFDALM